MGKAAGWFLVVLGGLWLALTGGCTAVFVGGALTDAFRNSIGARGVLVFLFIGAFCIAPGAAMLWLGLGMVKRSPVAAKTKPVDLSSTFD